MSNANFGPLDSPEHDFSDQSNFGFSDQSNFEFSELLMLGNFLDDDDPPTTSVAPGQSVQNSGFQANVVDDQSGGSSNQQLGGSTSIGGSRRQEFKERVAFKTKSEVEILDDGFKWRKYGKKMVKNSPNPRNYYKCSVEGCPVKKRVERDGEDPRFVITTYDGVHNHRSF